jgi:hypothetical protein
MFLETIITRDGHTHPAMFRLSNIIHVYPSSRNGNPHQTVIRTSYDAFYSTENYDTVTRKMLRASPLPTEITPNEV